MLADENYSERLLRVEETAQMIGSAVSTLNRARVLGGDYPPFVKLGKSVRYKMSSVRKWLEDRQEYQTTSQIDANKKSGVIKFTDTS
jgi:predicted DNA-binding transcriptional regulator AlpA